jgi:hypothetical protein
MSNTGRWIAVWIAILLVLGLLGMATYARGQKHHRGDEIGTHGTTPPALSQ